MASKREIWANFLRGIQNEFPFGPLQVKRNPWGKLHCETGPAYISPTAVSYWVDGKRHGVSVDIYGTVLNYYRGILIPRKWATHPEQISLDEILNNGNTEVRYAGLEIYGYERLHREKVFKLIHHDKNTGYKLLRYKGNLPEPITLVMVINSTPELNGGRKRYYLSVPPNMRTCAEAVAWTFGKEPDQYHPVIET